ncbi:kynurenine/alpha-aminoadipate aminotransferase, mitochondrial-like isoform 2-T3 [Salvelinus alpinus]
MVLTPPQLTAVMVTGTRLCLFSSQRIPPIGSLTANNNISRHVTEWRDPAAGMFLWIKLKDIADTQQLIMEKALEEKVSSPTHAS